MMRHSPKNWATVCFIQLGIIIGGFNLPNSIVNGATWYAPIIDFGRIALLLGFPVGDTIVSLNLLALGKRNKAYLKQFVDINSHRKYESINPLFFANLTSKQIDLIELTSKQSQNDLVLDPSFSFELLQNYLQGINRNV